MALTQQEVFQRLGYPKHAGRIYAALGSAREGASVTVLAQKAGVSRVVVYRNLKVMMHDHLIHALNHGKRKRYVVGSPARLFTLMRMTDHHVSREVVRWITSAEQQTPRYIQFLNGEKGIRFAFDHIINHTPKGETFYRYTSEQNLAEVNRYLAKDYRARRDRKRLERLVISNAVSGKQKRSRLERFIKFIPEETCQFEQNIIQLIYGNYVSVIDISAKQVMIIESKQLADFQKVIFHLLYKRL